MPFFPAAARRRFVASLAAAATVLSLMTASAVPARADPDAEDLAKALAAIAVFALIAKAGEDNDRGRARDRRRYDDDDHRYRPRHGGRFLPAECAVEVRRHGRGDRIVYSEHCLRRYGVTARLPYYCSIEARNRGRSITVFPQRCLIDAGFRTGNGRRHW